MAFKSASSRQLSTANLVGESPSEFAEAVIGGEFRHGRPNSGGQPAQSGSWGRRCSVAGEASVLDGMLLRSRGLEAALQGIAGRVLAAADNDLAACPNSPKIDADAKADRCRPSAGFAACGRA